MYFNHILRNFTYSQVPIKYRLFIKIIKINASHNNHLLLMDSYVVSSPIMIDYGHTIKGLHSIMKFSCRNSKFFSVERILRRHHTTIIYHLLSMDHNVISSLLTIDYSYVIKEMNKVMNFWCRNN